MRELKEGERVIFQIVATDTTWLWEADADLMRLMSMLTLTQIDFAKELEEMQNEVQIH